MEYLSSMERRAMERGRQAGILEGVQQGVQQGMQQGELSGRAATVLRLLARRWGCCPKRTSSACGRSPSPCSTGWPTTCWTSASLPTCSAGSPATWRSSRRPAQAAICLLSTRRRLEWTHHRVRSSRLLVFFDRPQRCIRPCHFDAPLRVSNSPARSKPSRQTCDQTVALHTYASARRGCWRMQSHSVRSNTSHLVLHSERQPYATKPSPPPSVLTYPYPLARIRSPDYLGPPDPPSAHPTPRAAR